MTIDLFEAINIAKQEALKIGVGIDDICFENPEGWRFGFIDKNGSIIPDDTCAMVTREGVFKKEFRGIPPMPIQNGHEIDISEYLKD